MHSSKNGDVSIENFSFTIILVFLTLRHPVRELGVPQGDILSPHPSVAIILSVRTGSASR